MRTSLTKRVIDAIQPGTKDAFLWDADPVGFGLKVTPSGGRIFVYQYRAMRTGRAGTVARRYTIGPYGKLTPDQARKRARELAAIVALGDDPMERDRNAREAKEAALSEAKEKARVENELAFDVIAARWLDHYEREKERRPASVRQARLVVRNHLSPHLGAKPIPKVERRDVAAIIDKIPAERRGMRRAVYAYGRILFGWAVAREMADSNPFIGMEKPVAPKARDRVLDENELRSFWKSTDGLHPLFAALFRLLLVTGQRRSEVAELRWGELDREALLWTIPAARAKNGKAHLVPLSDMAIAELDAIAGGEDWPTSGFVLSTTGNTPVSGISKAKRALDTAMGVDDWRLHDLRRSVATELQKIGTRFEVTEAILNHLSGAKGGIAGVYQRHDWADEKRTALNAWARRLMEIIENKSAGGNVAAIRAIA